MIDNKLTLICTTYITVITVITNFNNNIAKKLTKKRKEKNSPHLQRERIGSFRDLYNSFLK